MNNSLHDAYLGDLSVPSPAAEFDPSAPKQDKMFSQADMAGTSSDVARKLAVERGVVSEPSMEFNAPPPSQYIDKIKPIHRMMVYMAVGGKTQTEIAKTTGYSISQVSQIFRQPWFQAILKEECDAAGKDMVRTVLEAQVLPSIDTLIAVRDDTNEKGPARIAAANSLLDRFLGKPTVMVETKNTNITATEDSVEAKKRELAQLEANMRARGVSIINPGSTN